jgi:hypothetical protein
MIYVKEYLHHGKSLTFILLALFLSIALSPLVIYERVNEKYERHFLDIYI